MITCFQAFGWILTPQFCVFVSSLRENSSFQVEQNLNFFGGGQFCSGLCYKDEIVLFLYLLSVQFIKSSNPITQIAKLSSELKTLNKESSGRLGYVI